MARNWYILRVQSGREKRARDNVLRRKNESDVAEQIGEVLVPTEKVTEIKGGKRKVTTRKRYPGYIMVQLERPEEDSTDEQRELAEKAWFLVKDTPGVGDFVGTQEETVPMSPEEVQKMLNDESAAEEEAPKLDIRFAKGDNVKIMHGPFESFEGQVDEVDAEKGRVKVIVTIFGRQTPVELEYWEVEPV